MKLMSKPNLADEITVRIMPLQEKVMVEERKRDVTSVKSISLDDLVDCFQGSVRDSKYVSSGFLPANCLSCSISNDIKTVVVWHPTQRVDFTYYKTVYENFPLPRLVFGFDIDSNGRVRGYRMAVVKDEKPHPDTPLYQYPFSNVYANGAICVGAANSLPVYKNLWALASLPHHILSLPNNDHNFDRANNRLKLGYRELLDHLRDKEPAYYYEHVLKPKEGKTLQHFIDKAL